MNAAGTPAGEPFRICFVCSGNICRSPMGEVILRDLLAKAELADHVVVDSAGTGGWHEGDGADPRTVAALRGHGYDGSAHIAREFSPKWFAGRDLILAADRGHLRALRRMASTPADADRVRLLREFDAVAVAAGTLEVDDPWYGDASDFERCLLEVEAACEGVLRACQDGARTARPTAEHQQAERLAGDPDATYGQESTSIC